MDDVKKLMFDTEAEVLEQIASRTKLIWIDPYSPACRAMRRALDAAGYARNKPSTLNFKGQPIYFQIWWRASDAAPKDEGLT